MKIAIDAMGGDNAPEQIVKGAELAVGEFPGLEVLLVGKETEIRSHMSTENPAISILHTDEVIEGEDEPVRAVRRKKNSSMVLAAAEVAEGRADACISAGNTGALMTAGLFVVGRIKGIDRPALAPTLPTVDGKGFLLLDAGANVDAKPEHLLQFAIMGSIYTEKVRGIKNPTVGLMNIGTEEKKGNELSRLTFEMLKEADVNFIGNVESRDLLTGGADVVVCDGFTGNIALKTIEGTAMAIFSMLKEELTSSFKSKAAAAVLKPQFKKLKGKLDYSEYGGAGLFGLKAPVIKAHGSSDANAILNAVRQAKNMADQNVAGLIGEQAVKQS
ncbi:phosphate acyltransferase PlsX [Bacillus marinisedimentorum]|uniref:phosphate acyltransferase PlsX n=1 Tax=Bacillus marinisedimentorum TaxID=1821260 RepID=UPI0007E0420C|nr:phosphate acyltransferase PlsX [Bacillus marinisedimentorum]